MTTPVLTSHRSFLVRKRTSIGAILFCVLLILLLFVHHSWDETSFIDFLLDATGLLLIIMGVFGRLWCTLYIGGRKHAVLQCEGPYCLVRHPLYVSNLLLALGFSSLTENPVILLCVLTYFIIQYRVTIRYEETALLAKFGNAYAEYAQRVPCFLPKLRRVKLEPPTAINMPALQKELIRTAFFLMFIPALQLVGLLHDMHLLPCISFP